MARREGISDVSNLAMWMTSDWRGVCNLRKSNRWWQKSGKRGKRVGGCLIGKSREGRGEKKRCGWLPDWEVEGVVAAEKRDVGGCPIRKSSRSDGSERCG